MKIAESSVSMNAQWSQFRQHSAKEAIQFWNQEPNQGTKESILLNISEEGRALSQNSQIDSLSESEEDPYGLTERDKEKIALLEDFIYVLTGKRINFKPLNKLKLDRTKLAELKNAQPATPRPGVTPIRQGWGLRIDVQETTFEAEKMAFSSQGSVKTEDGREINFNLSFQVSRVFMESKSLQIRAGDALLDPLVINFKNASAALGDRNYSFDIDCDGKKDNIAFTSAGSGFLALDLNGNNSIDDGSELFGPQTGNGFNELATYDNDNNGWIDENDDIFDKLRIWTLDESGNRTLLALGQAGVGAIYLGNVQTEFGLKTSTNEMLGQIRQTGLFLKESGEAGTIQHVDLAI